MTKDYSLFEWHEHNRPLTDNPVLEQSMLKHGFLPGCPIYCVPGTSGKLKVMKGHKRCHYAKKHNLPIWYVVGKEVASIFDLEAGPERWSLEDFVHARAHAREPGYGELLAFKKAHGLTMGAAASLLGGESAGSGNKARDIKHGTWKIAEEQQYAKATVQITDRCREKEIAFATTNGFVGAIYLLVRLPEFDPKKFLHTIDLFGAKLRRRSRRDEYLEEIEALYNYGAKKRTYLKNEALEASRKRQATFDHDGRKGK